MAGLDIYNTKNVLWELHKICWWKHSQLAGPDTMVQSSAQCNTGHELSLLPVMKYNSSVHFYKFLISHAGMPALQISL